jgi:phosphate transport system permease protein
LQTLTTDSEPDQQQDDRAFRGSASVRFGDQLATLAITAGGLSVIAAVLGICVYLVYVTVPLLSPGRAEIDHRADPGLDAFAGVLLDEYMRSAAWLLPNGDAQQRSLINGRLAGSVDSPFAENARVLSFDATEGVVVAESAAGLEWGEIGFDYELISADEPPPFAERLDDGRFRVASVAYETEDVIEGEAGFRLADVLTDRRRTTVAAIDAEGRVSLWTIRRSRALVGGGASGSVVEIDTSDIEPVTSAVGLRLLDDNRCVVVRLDGSFVRLQIGRDSAEVIETGRLWENRVEVSTVATLLGRRTLVAGTADGRIGTWWVGADPMDSSDPGRMVSGPPLRRIDAAVTALEPSQRDRTLLVGDDRGGVRFLHASSGKTIAVLETGSPVRAVAPAPKLDGFLALTDAGQVVGSLDVGHPDVTPRSLFGGMLYEGQLEPMYVYQASGATDAAEPKLSLVPLIFGTIKATVVSMLFAAPIAILAAIYTSEFLSARFRKWVKPLIETMASLPSVVLGFVAAMVVAPFIADHLGVVLTGFAVVPATVLVVSGLVGLRSNSKSEAHGSSMLPVYVIAAAAAGVLLSVALADPLERSLFGPSRGDLLTLAGSVETDANGTRPVEPTDPAAAERVDSLASEFGRPAVMVKSWLSGVYGGALPGWVALAAPSIALVFAIIGWPLMLRRFPSVGDARWEPLARVGVSALVGLALGVVVATLLDQSGLDPRESILGVFTQRNTFVIGIVMGFAIIPIIYTISDDALQSVPGHLRAASYGAGATRWQTAVRVVMPVAASGIFSATMIGLGRAVGETMIVLMATGNTPIMEWNIFEGLRTLSANIAVELPEAERGGTHYRLLFLCGVVLFVMTFVVNTTAEIVRQRFRKRNALL